MKVRREVVETAELERVAGGDPLGEETVHYLCHVLRLREGDRVEIGDGLGRVLSGRLVSSGRQWSLADRSWQRISAPVQPSIALLFGLLKAKRWRLVVEKSVELGVARLVPVISERAVVRLHARDNEQFVERWQRVAREAGKQCGRPLITRIDTPRHLLQALKQVETPNRLVGLPQGEIADWHRHLAPQTSTTLLVGPEGGLTDPEVDDAMRAGFHPVSLGPYPLRAETVAVVLVAMVRDRLGIGASERQEEPCR
ncbi:MAG: 16S rRNA (uracil(1498)-N(3))-methyltransferase [Bradymonadales bacterium]|nr:16S rRNA (uracil(1498)-N(3))-methyltransferase [Bradymonadales bacterium]